MTDKTTRLVFELLGRDSASPVFDKFGKKVESNTRQLNLMSVATKGLAVGLAGGLVAGLGSVVAGGVRLEAAYSKTMAQVAVATDAPKAQLASLDKLALKLGADTVFSAQDAAGAMLDLSKGGLSIAQIKAGALADTLTLASAGGLELGESADDVVASLGAFHLQADQTDTAVAALAGGANASAASVSEMAQALTQVGTSAHASHVDIQQTTAYLALLANQGIKGSDAGTSLRTMFTKLVPTTKAAKAAQKELGLSYVDSNGHLVDAVEIANRTQKAFKNLSDEDRIRAVTAIFGADAQRAVNAITVEGAAGLKKYLKSTTDLSQAQKLAKAANSGTSGSLESLKGTIESAEIQLGKGLAPAIQATANNLNDLIAGADVQAWGEGLGDGLTIAGQGLKLTADAIKPVLKLVDEMPDDAKKALLLAGGIKVLSMALPSLGGNAIMAEAGLLRTRAGLAGLAIQANATRIGAGAAGTALLTFADNVSAAGSETNGLLKITGAVATGFAVGGPWGAAIGGGIEVLGLFGSANKQAKAQVDGLAASLDTQSGALTKNTKKMIVNALQKDGAFKLGGKLGVSAGDVTDAGLGNKAALAKIIADRNDASRAYAIAVAAGTASTGPDFGKQVVQYDALIKMLGGQSGALSEAKKAWEDEAAAKKESAAATKGSLELNKLSAAEITKVARATKGIPKSVVSKFTQPGYKDAVENAANLAKKYHLQPKEVATALKALDYSSPQIKAVIALMKKADKSDANPKIRVDTGDSLNKIRSIGTAIKDIHGKTVGIKVVGGTQLASANGNIFKAYASGGIENHVAQIGNGITRVWDEPETGGEAYIPLALSKRPRSRQIAVEAVSRLGGVAQFADGGTYGHRSNPAAALPQSAHIRDLVAATHELTEAARALQGLGIEVTVGIDKATSAKIVQQGAPALARFK